MAWNGAGVFNRLFSWTADKAAAINITASRMDSDTNDIVTQGLGNCITRDGQGQPTANLPMATFRHTGVANGVARTDYAAMGQLEDGTTNWAAAGGTGDAIAATYAPAITALVDGQLCFVRAGAANTLTNPTFAPNGLTARTITKVGGAALSVGDINGANHELILRYNLANTRWELCDPASSTIVSTDPGAGTGPGLTLFRDSASPAVSDFIGAVILNGRNDAAAIKTYLDFKGQLTNVTAGAEAAIWIFQQFIAGVLTTVLQSTASAWTSVLTFASTNVTAGLSLAGGTTGQRNGSPTAGDTRYNTTLSGLEYWNGTAWIVLGQQVTIQSHISPLNGDGASHTYTAATGVVRQRVRIWGPGGGGGAVTLNVAAAAGSADTSFQVNGTGTAWTAVKGSGGAAAAGAGGAGGTGGTIGAGTQIARQVGARGQDGMGSAAAASNGLGGQGGSSPFGGAGAGRNSAAGTAAASNSGSGGGGAGGGSAQNGGAGGGAGEYVEFVVTGMTTATYTIGLGGAGGTAGTNAGGPGANGGIIIEEFYS